MWQTGNQQDLSLTNYSTLQSEEEGIKQKLGNVILGTMISEARIEDERLKLSEDSSFFPEIAFNFLKTFSSRLKEVNKFSSFFDFSAPNDVIEYNQLDSYKSGFISYQQLITFLQFYEVRCTDKILECVAKYYDPISYQNGLCYDAFTKIVIPQSVPSARLKVLKRKVIYETSSQPQQMAPDGVISSKGAVPSLQVVQSLVLIFDLECNLITFTERCKVKLQHSLQQKSFVQMFEMVDSNKKGFIDFQTIQEFAKKVSTKMVPSQYLGLLRRLKKPVTVETLSFQDFKDLLVPNFPFFCPQNNLNLDQTQNYYETNKTLDISKTLQMTSALQNKNVIGGNSKLLMSTKNPQQQLSSQTLSQAARGSYQNPSEKIYFKDSQGRIVEKNHPFEPVLLPEDQHFSDQLKQNVNIVHHPYQDKIYTIIPQTYEESAPLIKKKVPIKPLPQQIPVQTQTITFMNNYELPKVDPKDLTGVDPFWQRPAPGQRRDLFQTQNQQTAAAASQSQQPGQISPQIDISQIQDQNALKIIKEQQQLISKLQNEKSSVQMQKTTQAPIPSQRPLGEQYQEMYKTSPYLQDIVQMRHANTTSYDPLAQPNTRDGVMKNTNLIQSQFNAKTNPHLFNRTMPNGIPASSIILGQPSISGNAVSIESMNVPINQIAKSSIFNPALSKVRQQGGSKKKIFDQSSSNPYKMYLNDQTYKLGILDTPAK